MLTPKRTKLNIKCLEKEINCYHHNGFDARKRTNRYKTIPKTSAKCTQGFFPDVTVKQITEVNVSNKALS